MSVNRFICTGNLTRDPELRALASGTTVCRLRVAVDGMGRGGEPGFVNVSVFDKQGEAAAEILGKGWLVAVEGRLVYERWETDEGEKRHDYAVIGNVQFLAPPRNADPSDPPARTRARARKEPVAA